MLKNLKLPPMIKSEQLDKFDRNFLFLVILSALGAIYLLLYWRSNTNFNNSLIESIFIIGLFYQIYNKQIRLNPSSNYVAQIIGFAIILVFCFKAKYLFLVEASVFLYFFPPVTIFGYILFVSGFRGIYQFRRELSLLTIVIFLSNILRFLSNRYEGLSLTFISAKLSSLFLWYIGFEPQRQGTIIFVNNGAVDVYFDCTAVPLLIPLLKMSLIVPLFFPSLYKKIFSLFFLSFVISFILSLIRIAIMALVVNDKTAFNYWHSYEGGNIFTMIGMGIFFGIILIKTPSHNPDDIESLPPKTKVKLRDLPIFSSALILIIILLNFIFDTRNLAGANRVAKYDLPQNIDLPYLDLQDSFSQPLIPISEDDAPTPPPEELNSQEKYDLVLSERTYKYQKGDDIVTVNLRYLTNTFGTIESYYQNYTNVPKLENSIDRSFEDNYYLKFVSDNQTHLTACLNSEGKTTVTRAQFASYYHRAYVQPSKLWDWLMGKRLLQDRRCLWIELSVDQNSNVSDEELSKILSSIVEYWQSRFPPVR